MLCRRHLFQGHPTPGTATGSVGGHLGVHGTLVGGVDGDGGARRRPRRRPRRLWHQIHSALRALPRRRRVDIRVHRARIALRRLGVGGVGRRRRRGTDGGPSEGDAQQQQRGPEEPPPSTEGPHQTRSCGWRSDEVGAVLLAHGVGSWGSWSGSASSVSPGNTPWASRSRAWLRLTSAVTVINWSRTS